ncbi:MAG: S24/S26 family peptidase [Oscillospiraceae bacterium]|nr:S24/S26 family peptidase [Oscillospiraceae bacterium]
MDKSGFEEILARDGRLVYSSRGDSMLPLIREGRDLLVIEPVHGRLRRLDVPLYRRAGGRWVLHRVLRVQAEDYVLCGDNRWRCETGVTDRQIAGVLTAVIRGGREIPMTDWRCRLYAHLWCDLFPLRALLVRGIGWIKRTRRKHG